MNPSLVSGFDPPRGTTRIWRHIDLARFASMLATAALWFSRVTTLEDAFEGSYPVPTSKRLALVESTFEVVELPLEARKPYLDSLGRRRIASLREGAYVNCWYSGLHESAALWQWAARQGASVAIRSTYDKLLSSVASTESLSAGRVRYLNYQKEDVPFADPLGIFFCKRQSFAHEKEVRLLADRTDPKSQRPERGLLIEVNLAAMIERVVIAPLAPDWQADVVRSLVDRYDLPVPVHKSELDAAPIY